MDLIIARASGTATGVPTNGLLLLNAFTCSGTITALVLGVDVRTESGTYDQYPEIFLRRPIDSDEPDGDNRIVPSSLRTVRLTPANFSTSGAFDYPLDPPLEFQANDVLGWNQPEPGKSVVRMFAIDGRETTGSSSLLIYPVTGEMYSYIVHTHVYLRK